MKAVQGNRKYCLHPFDSLKLVGLYVNAVEPCTGKKLAEKSVAGKGDSLKCPGGIFPDTYP